MRTTWPSPQTVLQAFERPGKQPGARIDGTVRTPGTVSRAVDAKDGGAQQHRRGRGAPLPPEADENTESTMVVGWTHSGNFCHVPITIHRAPRTALVDTGSTVTLMRPDVVPAGTQLEQTTVQLRTVTGELAPILGKGRVTLNVGDLSVDFTVWVAQV